MSVKLNVWYLVCIALGVLINPLADFILNKIYPPKIVYGIKLFDPDKPNEDEILRIHDDGRIDLFNVTPDYAAHQFYKALMQQKLKMKCAPLPKP